MNATTADAGHDSPPSSGGDFPWLRVAVGAVTAVGLTVSVGLGIAAILGASLGTTAIRVAGTGVILGLYGLFAVGSTTLRQRSVAWQLLGVVGVLAATLATVITVIDVWSTTPPGATSGRVALIAAVVAFALGFTGFLLTHQRAEDTTGLRSLMVGTLTSSYILAVALIIDVLVSSNSSSLAPVSTSSSTNLASAGVGFDRFIAVVGLLTLLGTLLLPVLRRANPAFRGGGRSGTA